MGRAIVKFGDKYCEWSTVSDSPVTYMLTLDEFKEHYRDVYGKNSMDELDKRLARVEKNSTSFQDGTTLAELLESNHAGPDKTCVTTVEEMLRLWAVPTAEGDPS